MLSLSLGFYLTRVYAQSQIAQPVSQCQCTTTTLVYQPVFQDNLGSWQQNVKPSWVILHQEMMEVAG